MSFALFLLLNSVLLIRPVELIPGAETIPLYQLVIFGCLATTYPAMLNQVSGWRLGRQPLTACMLALLGCVVLSHLRHGSIYDARMSGFEFFKIVLYFLLLLANLNTPERFQQFLTWLVRFVFVATSLAVVHFYELANIPALAAYAQREIDEETGEIIIFQRLCGTGIFNDPNDICLLLSMAMMLCLYRFKRPGAGPLRFVLLIPMALFLVAFLETKSRGGFLSLMVSLNVLMVASRGIRRSIPLWLLGAPAVLVVFGGRMTRIEVDGGTGQHRIQLWREALSLLREFPIFGVGQGLLHEYTRLVAHNSYIHAFAELGILGGGCFISFIYLAIAQLRDVRRDESQIEDSELRRFRPYLLGIVCGYAAGIMFLSRVYIVPTYLIPGLVAAWLNLVEPARLHSGLKWRLNSGLVARLSAVSITGLIGLELFSRAMVRWEG